MPKKSEKHTLFGSTPVKQGPPLLDQIKTMRIVDILTQAEENESFELACKDPRLATFWEERSSELYQSRFRPQNLKHMDAFTQYRGYYHYNLASMQHELDDIKSGKLGPNLTKALLYGFYPAIMHALAVTQPIDDKILLLNNIVPQHTSLTYLTQHNEYVNYLQQLLMQKTPDLSPEHYYFLEQAYIALYIAKSLHNQTQHAMHNASFGLGMKHLFPQFTTFDNAQEKLIDLMRFYNPSLTTEFIYHLMTRARSSVTNITNEFYPVMEETGVNESPKAPI